MCLSEATRRCQKLSRIISTVQFLQRVIWNWWRTDCVRMEKFPRTYVIGDPPEDPGRLARSKHWTWRFWRSNHLHVKCSTTSNGRIEEFHNNVFQIPNTSRIKRGDSRKDSGHSLDRETKRSGTELSVIHPERKLDSTATQMVVRFNETGHSVF